MTRKQNATQVLLLSMLVITACDSAQPTAPGQVPAAAMAIVQPEDATNTEVLTRAIPGFGGLYFDAGGRPVVYLTDVRQAGRARRALEEIAEENGRHSSEIIVLQARNSHEDLKKWYDASWADALDTEGAVFSDLDEANNRILIGVESHGSREKVKAKIKLKGVPNDAVAIEIVEPIRQLATLRDVVRPIVGGLQIHFGNYLCTLGFNARFGTTNAFITNSHCTNTQGGVEGTVYYQPTSTASSQIATEVTDPTYSRGGGCPKSKRCRYSDSSRANYVSGFTQFTLGGIAATGAGS